MRDDHIYRMNENQGKRFSLIYQQFEFLATKVEAYEKALSTRKGIFYAILFPERFRLMVNRLHMGLIREEQAKIEELKKKAREESSRPKIITLSGNGVHR